jgi:hypothetical protein
MISQEHMARLRAERREGEAERRCREISQVRTLAREEAFQSLRCEIGTRHAVTRDDRTLVDSMGFAGTPRQTHMRPPSDAEVFRAVQNWPISSWRVDSSPVEFQLEMYRRALFDVFHVHAKNMWNLVAAPPQQETISVVMRVDAVPFKLALDRDMIAGRNPWGIW